MRFTSYVTDFHDVTLWRALGHIAAGRYIDMAAHEEDLGRAFREQTWEGIHREGKALPDVVLDAVLDACSSGPVHWLHLDARDLAAGVLDGWRRSAVRPWIVMVSHVGDTQGLWQATLLNKGYGLAGRTADTLFYVLQGPLAPAVQLAHLPQDPARSSILQQALDAAGQRLVMAEQQAALANNRADTLRRELAAASAQALQVTALEQHLQAVLASTSWRVTRPLRWVVRLRQAPGDALRELVAVVWSGKPGALARCAARAVLARPAVRRVARQLAARHPGLAQRLRGRLQANTPGFAAPVTAVPAASNPANMLGPRFGTLLLDDLAQFSHAPAQQGKI